MIYLRNRHHTLIKFINEEEKFLRLKEKWISFLEETPYREIIKKNKEEGKENLEKKAKILLKRNTIQHEADKKLTENNLPNLNRKTVTRDNVVRNKKNTEILSINDKKFKPSLTSVAVAKNVLNKQSNLTNKNDSVNDSAKSFICIGGYPAIKKSLLERGYVENPDPNSLNFDVKWVLRTKDIPSGNMLNKKQIVNHFLNNVEITKKSGLAKNLRNMIFRGVDIDNFYPRSYELSERNEFEDFLENFKLTKALGLLKQFHIKGKREFDEEKLKIAIDVCRRRLSCKIDLVKNFCKENEFDIGDLKVFNEYKPILDKEWCIISEEDSRLYTREIEKLEKMNKIGFVKTEQRSSSILPIIKSIVECDNNAMKNVRNNSKNKIRKNGSTNKLDDNKKNNKQIKISNKLNQNSQSGLEKYAPIIGSIIENFEKNDPQYLLNGDKNIWILKPCGLSRGRGIICLNTLNEVLTMIKRNSNQYIAQKYIENPLIILGRKFDIRQWVLVTDLNPLTIWIYDTPYLRFGAEDYNIDEISNLYSHLTNNSVVKYSKNFLNDKIDGNMWECEQFVAYLKTVYGKDIWKTVIQDKIKKIIICSMESVKNNIINRKNSHELYGYDIMIDEKLNAWLIEVNSSPAMDYSTPTTEKLVKLMSEDLIKVVVDYASSDNKDKLKISTGRFIKIHTGEMIDPIKILPNNL